MTIKLKNKRFEAVFNTLGAEINSLKSIGDNTEYIWTGDPSVWKFHAPILFPHVGRIRDGYTVVGDKEFKLGCNGFARDLEFKLLRHNTVSAEFELNESDYTADKYPWKFSLRVFYELTDTGLVFRSTVTDTDADEITFSLGSHTAFCCPRNTDPAGTKNSDYQIEFEKKEPLTSVVCVGDGYLGADEEGTAPYTKLYGEKNPGIIPLDENGFGNGHFFTAFNSDWVGLRNKKTGQLIKVNTSAYPYLMVWQNKGTPRFVCIEPWYGTPDPDVTDHRWENKPALLSLKSGESFTADQTITIG
jgi:galactose mutarotase-like enzyme